MTEATPQGAAVEPQKTEEPKGLQPDLERFNQVEDMATRLKESRETDIKEQLEADPGFKALEDGFQSEMHPEGEETPLEEGVESVTPIDEVEDPPKVPDEEKDPLKDYIVMEDGKPMFEAKVDGERRLIPLERAQAQLQKHEAAEQRLQKAAEMTRQLAERERALRENEQVLQQRLTNPPPGTQASDADNEDLDAQAKDLVETMFSGTEDEAAEKLAKVLRQNRAPAQTSALDTNEIIQRAATTARAQMAEEQRVQDAHSGYNKFAEEYPDIMADPVLFRVADGMTDEIQAENPDWKPSQVMHEAGKKAREWYGAKEEKAPVQEGDTTLSDRKERKAQLTPMPRAATARQPKKPEERPETPQEALEKMREARGQPV